METEHSAQPAKGKADPIVKAPKRWQLIPWYTEAFTSSGKPGTEREDD